MEEPIKLFDNTRPSLQDHSVQVASEMYSNALYYLQIEQPEIAVQYLKAAAFNNHPAAQFEFGRCYELGLGIEQNQQRALKWYQRAEQHGYVWEKNTFTSVEDIVDNSNQLPLAKDKEEAPSHVADFKFIRRHIYPCRNIIHQKLEQHLFNVIDDLVTLLQSRGGTSNYHAFLNTYHQFKAAGNKEQLFNACENLICYGNDLNILDAFLELAMTNNKVSDCFSTADFDEAYRVVKQRSSQESVVDNMNNHGLFSRKSAILENLNSSEEYFQRHDSESSHTSDASQREERAYLEALIDVDMDNAEDSYDDDSREYFQMGAKK